jgi:3-dehydroquinate synthase
VVTDSTVGPLYGARVVSSLEAAGFSPFLITVPSGEVSKAFGTVEAVCDEMVAAGLDRSSSVVALGGGVVGDLAGFVASIYHRGVPYIQIPTTVVAQVDSSVGGKTGVNTQGGKNLIGAFHQPRLVVADPKTLETLPEREYNEGFAEIIKHAAIRDPEMLGEMDGIVALVARNVGIKAAIVVEDEFETKGLRALLNFGHTIGHAIEKAAGYGRYLHGEAISLGLVAACRLSVSKAGLAVEESERVISALERYRLPVVLPAEIPAGEIMGAMRTDKKFREGAVRFVLLRQLGDAFVSSDVNGEDLRRAVEELYRGGA